MAFKVGDTVQLKSGGYPMVVIAVRQSLLGRGQLCKCTWMNLVKAVTTQTFPASVLAITTQKFKVL